MMVMMVLVQYHSFYRSNIRSKYLEVCTWYLMPVYVYWCILYRTITYSIVLLIGLIKASFNAAKKFRDLERSNLGRFIGGVISKSWKRTEAGISKMIRSKLWTSKYCNLLRLLKAYYTNTLLEVLRGALGGGALQKHTARSHS